MDELTTYILPGIRALAKHDMIYQELLWALDQERLRYEATLNQLQQDARFAIEDYCEAYFRFIRHSLRHAYHLGFLQKKIESPDGDR